MPGATGKQEPEGSHAPETLDVRRAQVHNRRFEQVNTSVDKTRALFAAFLAKTRHISVFIYLNSAIA